MESFAPRSVCLAVAALLAVGLVTLVSAQQIPTSGNSVVTDWSSHRLVFSDPGTEQDALANGTHDRWVEVVNNPRYIWQQLERRLPAQGPASEYVAALEQGAAGDINSPARERQKIKRDWSEALQTGAVLPNAFAATFAVNYGTPNCVGDYAVYPTGSVGSATSATIIAYHNLYVATCSGAVPQVYWAYSTGARAVTTSPVISADGTKIAFVQSTSSAVDLVVLKWSASGGSVSSPTTPTTTVDITTCAPPCMTATTVIGTTNGNAYSSPYYDYASDALYFGDNDSHLYKFSGIFNTTGSPRQSMVTLNSTAHDVASPVYDSTSGCVFVGDSQGFFYSVSSGVPGTVCTGSNFALFGHSENLGNGSGNEGIFDAPLVDSTADSIYAFVAASRSLTNCTAIHNCIVQFAASTITSGSTTAAPLAEGDLGRGGPNYNIYDGAFDNVYYSSTNGSSPTGNIYVVGGTLPSTSQLYQVPITNNSLGAPASKASLHTRITGVWASPATEFCNNGANSCVVTGGVTTSGEDYIFFSGYELNLTTTSGGTACANQGNGKGCVVSWIVNNPSNIASTPASDLAVNFPNGGVLNDLGCWGTGAFSIDNSATQAGASQVYFVNMNGNSSTGASSSVCNIITSHTIQAVQASQSGLN